MAKRTTKPKSEPPKDGELRLIEPREDHFFRSLRNSFFTGIVVAAPIGITAYLVYAFVTFVDGRIKPLVPPRYNPETYLDIAIPGFGVLVAVITLTLLGALARNLFGRSVLIFGESLVSRVPLVRNIYGALKQLFETIAAQSEANFQDVVLIEYPRKGIHALGFLTSQAKGELKTLFPEDNVAVFVPTTPNPTSGFLLYLPKKDITVLSMSVEDGAKLIVSAGIVAPEANGDGDLPAITQPEEGDVTPTKTT